tara:strand:+ start:3618 stop:5633 length:2016 start_codon:yes stop_codon:yes gene_type:complete
MENGSAWHSKIDNNKICWLAFDTPNKSANVLSEKALIDLDKILDELHLNTPRGLVFTSSKKTGFILGADINEFTNSHKFDDIYKATIFGQSIMNKIENLRCPTVALLNGFTLGGGLELALSCDYIISTDSNKKCLGFPEVKLGLLPGFGGYLRSIKKIGPISALDLMLTGKFITPKQAFNLKLIDVLTPWDSSDNKEIVAEYILSKPKKTQAKWYLRILNFLPFRILIYLSIKNRIRKKIRSTHYPAPFSILNLWKNYGSNKRKAHIESAKSFCHLYLTDSSKNLIRVYKLSDTLKSLASKEKKLNKAHIIGGGTMGADIASWCALKGIHTNLQDKDINFLQPGLKRAKKLFKSKLKNESDILDASKRLNVDLLGEKIKSADIIIEAITEDLKAKQELFKSIENEASSSAIIATNTSSIKIEDIAKSMSQPERLVGIHFFNPVHRLPLVEIVKGKQTSKQIYDAAISYVAQIGKLPLPCNSAPGFVVNRILAPYMNQALVCLMDGYKPETIDKAAKDFGMPTGPIELADRVGLDIALHVVEVFGATPPDILKTKVIAGELGAKTGKGFYTFVKNRPKKSSKFPNPDKDLSDRLIYSLLNESMSCLDDGVVNNMDLIDAAVIFGTGFAPFTGGPLNYAKSIGIDHVVDRLESLEKSFGSDFRPSKGWKKLTI